MNSVQAVVLDIMTNFKLFGFARTNPFFSAAISSFLGQVKFRTEKRAHPETADSGGPMGTRSGYRGSPRGLLGVFQDLQMVPGWPWRILFVVVEVHIHMLGSTVMRKCTSLSCHKLSSIGLASMGRNSTSALCTQIRGPQ